MLILSRRVGESIAIGKDVQVMVTKVSGSKAQLGVTAPRGIPVGRGCEILAHDEPLPPEFVPEPHEPSDVKHWLGVAIDALGRSKIEAQRHRCQFCGGFGNVTSADTSLAEAQDALHVAMAAIEAEEVEA